MRGLSGGHSVAAVLVVVVVGVVGVVGGRGGRGGRFKGVVIWVRICPAINYVEGGGDQGGRIWLPPTEHGISRCEAPLSLVSLLLCYPALSPCVLIHFARPFFRIFFLL